MTKEIYVDVFFFPPAIAHLQKAPITTSSENVPDSRCSAHGRKYYYFRQITCFTCSYSKIYT